MWKLSTAAIAATLLANANFDLESYVRKDLVKNPRVKVNRVELIGKKELKDHKGWSAYMFMIDLEMGKKKDKFADMVFINEKEGLATQKLYDYKTHKDLGQDIRPEIGDKYYRDDHLIAGKKDAKHKIVVFSDPECPFCRQNVPEIYKTVKENPDTFALYYYHMPLRIHPSADALTRIMEVLQKQGKFDKVIKVYDTKVTYNEKNETKILDTINKELGENITLEEIKKPEYKKRVEEDKEMAIKVMLKGTPTVYIDGKFQRDIKSYKKLIKK
jgi:protein-disulfide isomerase